MSDTKLNVPGTVTVVFQRADAGELGSGFYLQIVTGSGHDGTQPIHSSAIANFAAGGTEPENETELVALAAQIAADFYAWRRASLEVRYESVIPWTSDGLHDIEYLHDAPPLGTAVMRSSWEPEQGYLKHAGAFGSVDRPRIGEVITGMILLEDRKPTGTSGGSSVAGVWQMRDLTAEVEDTGDDCTLTANEFTLLAGTYLIEANAPGYCSAAHQIRLHNATDGTYVYGTSEWNPTITQTMSKLYARLELEIDTTFALEHQFQTALVDFGLGVANGFGAYEVYAQVRILRLGEGPGGPGGPVGGTIVTIPVTGTATGPDYTLIAGAGIALSAGGTSVSITAKPGPSIVTIPATGTAIGPNLIFSATGGDIAFTAGGVTVSGKVYGTAGAVLYIGPSGFMAQQAGNFSYDEFTFRVSYRSINFNISGGAGNGFTVHDPGAGQQFLVIDAAAKVFLAMNANLRIEAPTSAFGTMILDGYSNAWIGKPGLPGAEDGFLCYWVMDSPPVAPPSQFKSGFTPLAIDMTNLAWWAFVNGFWVKLAKDGCPICVPLPSNCGDMLWSPDGMTWVVLSSRQAQPGYVLTLVELEDGCLMPQWKASCCDTKWYCMVKVPLAPACFRLSPTELALMMIDGYTKNSGPHADIDTCAAACGAGPPKKWWCLDSPTPPPSTSCEAAVPREFGFTESGTILAGQTLWWKSASPLSGTWHVKIEGLTGATEGALLLQTGPCESLTGLQSCNPSLDCCFAYTFPAPTSEVVISFIYYGEETPFTLTVAPGPCP